VTAGLALLPASWKEWQVRIAVVAVGDNVREVKVS
jgi:hypothetical protein